MLCGSFACAKSVVGNFPFSAALAWAAERCVDSSVVGGRLAAHSGGCGDPVSWFSNPYCGTTGDLGAVPPLAAATAKSIAVRTIQVWESTVKSWNCGSELWSCFQAHDSWFESSVATAGIFRRSCLNAPNESARAAPKSVVKPSIFGYLARSAATTCSVLAGSQFVTLYGVCPTK